MSGDQQIDLDRSDARRRRVRRWVLIALVPIAVAALVLAGKFLVMSSTAAQSVREYRGGDVESSIESAGSLMPWNWFDTWLPYYDRGAVFASSGRYNEAVDDLERAFALAPESRRCEVAVNLSLSWERLGDSYAEQGLASGAAQLYANAQAVIDAAGEQCAPGQAPQNEESGRDPGEELGDASERLEQKQGQAEQEADQQQGGGTSEEQLDRLEQQDDDAAQEKSDQEGADRDAEGGGAFTDRPW